MAEIINLRQARKNKVRAAKEQVAEENRFKFGQTKAEKKKNAAVKKRNDAQLDGHKRSD